MKKSIFILGLLLSATAAFSQPAFHIYWQEENRNSPFGNYSQQLMYIVPTRTYVGIGTNSPTTNLEVAGGIKTEELDATGIIRATEVKVCLEQGYNLMPLEQLSEFITTNKHLPEIAPAAEMESNGINLSEMNAKLLQKVEELTLYLINLQQQIDELKK